MLLYVVEGAVPILLGLLIWADVLAIKKNHEKHKKVAMVHAVATWVSTLLLIVLIRLGFRLSENAPGWIQEVHQYIIFAVPPILLALALTGLYGKRALHLPVAALYVVSWIGALTTGGMMFAMARGWM